MGIHRCTFLQLYIFKKHTKAHPCFSSLLLFSLLNLSLWKLNHVFRKSFCSVYLSPLQDGEYVSRSFHLKAKITVAFTLSKKAYPFCYHCYTSVIKESIPNEHYFDNKKWHLSRNVLTKLLIFWNKQIILNHEQVFRIISIDFYIFKDLWSCESHIHS